MNDFEIPTYSIEVGIIGESKGRKDGVTNAELLFIHENGTATIPRRPVLQMTIDYVEKSLLEKIIDKGIEGFLTDGEKGLEKSLAGYVSAIEDYARDIIYSNDGRLTPNAPSVAKAKKEKAIKNARSKAEREDIRLNDTGNHPLFDTGEMARHIIARLTKGG